MKKQVAILTLLALAFATACSAQMGGDKSKRPSPPASASCDLGGGKSVKTDYSSPRMKGRTIYGGLVPYGQVWRTGANEATTFVTSSDITVGGTHVPAGSYTIFTVPNADKWTLVISKGTGEWGTDYPGPDKDLARVDMKVTKLPSPVENFTISFEKGGGATVLTGTTILGGSTLSGGITGCAMHLDWETTRASVDIAAK